MRKVVVNSTPLIALSKVGLLHIFRELYGEIIIPQAVFHEVTAKNDVVNQLITENLDWIHIVSAEHNRDRRMYTAKLHDGEVEVMIIAQEIAADLVVIDDGAARKTADYLGLPLTGTLGVLLRAKERGAIQRIKPIIVDMESQGIYYSERLKAVIQRVAGE